MKPIGYDTTLFGFLFPISLYLCNRIMPKAKAKVKAVKRGVPAPKKSVKAKAVKRGGTRSGAGRPVGSGKYGCKTKAVRVPEHLIGDIQAFVMRKIKAERK